MYSTYAPYPTKWMGKMTAITQWSASRSGCMTYTVEVLTRSQVIGIPIEMDTATAKARTNRMGVATSSAIVPKPILQYKENKHFTHI